ncbi:MAG: hypothetical protein ACRDQW_09555, partial [Haloechinothrix sp.]
LIVGVTAAALAAGGLVGLGTLGAAQAGSCPSTAQHWVPKSCLSNVRTVAIKYNPHVSSKNYAVSLRVGTFRGRTYAFAQYWNRSGYGNYDCAEPGCRRVQIDGNSYGYDWGQQTRTVRSTYSRYTSALRSTSRSDVRFRACTWWWNGFDNRVEGKYCTSYW